MYTEQSVHLYSTELCRRQQQSRFTSLRVQSCFTIRQAHTHCRNWSVETFSEKDSAVQKAASDTYVIVFFIRSKCAERGRSTLT